MVRRNDSQSKKDEEVKTMDKMFELINSLNALTKAVEGLTAKITSEYLDTFEEIYSPEMDEPKEESKEQPTPEQQTVTFVELRSRLSEISRNGHTAEVKELLRKFGADKLSDVAESDYTALLAEAEVIANAGYSRTSRALIQCKVVGMYTFGYEKCRRSGYIQQLCSTRYRCPHTLRVQGKKGSRTQGSRPH